MPEHRPAPDAPGRAVEATIARIRDALLTDCDPDTLNEIRAAFRRQIPFRLRSYAAALLILEASAKPSRDGGRGEARRKDREGKQQTERQPKQKQAKVKQPQAEQKKQASEPASPALDENLPRYKGEGTTIFFGMGKRQRLYSRVLLRILMENGSLASDEIGEIRSFDNYSFADVDPLKADALIEAMASFAFRGRVLPVNKARKRGEARPEGDEAASNLADEGSLEPVNEEESTGVEYEEDENYDDSDELRDDFTDSDEGIPDDPDEEDAKTQS